MCIICACVFKRVVRRQRTTHLKHAYQMRQDLSKRMHMLKESMHAIKGSSKQINTCLTYTGLSSLSAIEKGTTCRSSSRAFRAGGGYPVAAGRGVPPVSMTIPDIWPIFPSRLSAHTPSLHTCSHSYDLNAHFLIAPQSPKPLPRPNAPGSHTIRVTISPT